MKHIVFAWAATAIMVMAIGCAPSPEELIVGKWQFDQMTAKEGVSYLPEDSMVLEIKNNTLKENNLAFNFTEDKKCSITGTGSEVAATYTLTDGKTLQLLIPEQEPQTAEIITLTETDLTLSFDDPTMEKELLHFKKGE